MVVCALVDCRPVDGRAVVVCALVDGGAVVVRALVDGGAVVVSALITPSLGAQIKLNLMPPSPSGDPCFHLPWFVYPEESYPFSNAAVSGT